MEWRIEVSWWECSGEASWSHLRTQAGTGKERRGGAEEGGGDGDPR